MVVGVTGICVVGVAGLCVAGLLERGVVVYDELKSQVLINVLEDAPNAYSAYDIIEQ